MRQRNEHFPEKNILKKTLTASATVTPDLELADVFRYTTTEDLTIANPANSYAMKDGQYIRIEVLSEIGKEVNFGDMFNVDGVVIPDAYLSGYTGS